MESNKQKRWTKLLLIATSLILFSTVYAASVLKTTIDAMLTESELVFEGRVTSVESKLTGPKQIHTFVTCKIKDIIKGQYSEQTITLRFLGGTVGNQTMTVSGIQVPRNGERGIYFVESLDRNQVHPLFGWSQGHFTVIEDGIGINRIMTSKNQPITGLCFDPETMQQKKGTKDVKKLSTGVATGVTIEQNRNATTGLTLIKFKQILKERLNEKIK